MPGASALGKRTPAGRPDDSRYLIKVSGGTAAAINAAAALADGVNTTVLKLDHKQKWTLENTVVLKSNTTLDLGGQTLTAIGGTVKFPDTVMIANADQVNGNSYVRIINGKLDGNVANNAGKSFWGIYLKRCDHSDVLVDTVNTPSRGWQIEGNGTTPKPHVIRLRGTVDNCGDYAINVTNGMRDVYWDDVVVQNCRSPIAAVYIDASEQYGRISSKFNASGSGIRFNNVFGCDLELLAVNNGQHGVYVKQLNGSRVRIKSHNNGTLSAGVSGSGYADVYVSDVFDQSYGVNQETTLQIEAGPITQYGGATDVFGAATEDYALYVMDGNSAALDYHFIVERIGPGSLVAATRMPATKPGLTLAFPGSDRRVTASADVTLTQDGLFTTDTDLTATLQVGEYEMDGYLLYESTATADLKVGLVTPTGTTGSWTAYGAVVGTAAAAQSGSLYFTVLGPGATQPLGGVNTGTTVSALIRGRLVVTTAGTVAMRFAQNTAEVSNTIRHAGSWLHLRRVA